LGGVICGSMHKDWLSIQGLIVRRDSRPRLDEWMRHETLSVDTWRDDSCIQTVEESPQQHGEHDYPGDDNGILYLEKDNDCWLA